MPGDHADGDLPSVQHEPGSEAALKIAIWHFVATSFDDFRKHVNPVAEFSERKPHADGKQPGRQLTDDAEPLPEVQNVHVLAEVQVTCHLRERQTDRS